jgi:hypothetical protein
VDVARQLGWLKPNQGAAALARCLRGRGGRRKTLNQILKLVSMSGVKPSGLVTRERLALCEHWVAHLRERGIRSRTQLEQHIDSTLHPRDHEALRTDRAELYMCLWGALESVLPRYKYKDSVLAVDVLAALAGVDPASVRKEFYRQRRRSGLAVVDPRLAILPPTSARSPAIFYDVARLSRALSAHERSKRE